MTNNQRSNILPVAIGIGLTCILLAGLAVLAHMRRNADADGAPQLAIVSPAPGESVDSPLVVRFRSSRPLALKSSGWGHAGFHIHAIVNGVQYMPAASDIAQRDTLYEWTIAPHARGPFVLQLAWADPAHRPVLAGASDTVTALLR